jgi:hypothetical protein
MANAESWVMNCVQCHEPPLPLKHKPLINKALTQDYETVYHITITLFEAGLKTQFDWTHTYMSRCITWCLRGGNQNIPDWCRHLHSSCGSAKHRPQQAKLWIPGSTAMFCGDYVKTCEDVTPNFGENSHGCFTMTALCLTLPSSPSSFWRNWSWKDAGLIPSRRSRKRSKSEGDGGTGVYMR